MSEYIVSARKYRPLSFNTVVGQEALTATLKNAVKSGKLAHAYLFCGPRGVGKTTCARIFAKAINCQSPTQDGEACNECESCKAFNEQRSFNIFELDAASNNSVEHIKSLMEQTRIPPQFGRYKVFIIDEVHMLSTAAFNAFLKTLEEPPSHTIFILATTEKHKILPTILSRCQIYDFDRMTVGNTINHLKNVAQKEGISYEEEALAVIAEKADGGMRDALSIFDQTASFCQGNITYQQVIENLNVLDTENYFNIIDMSLENKAADIMVLLNRCINKGFDGGLLIQGLAKHVRNVMMAKDPQTTELLETSERMRERYKAQAEKCPVNFLYKALRIMNQCDINYRTSSNKRLLVELTLIEIAQITQPDEDPGSGHGPKRLKKLFRLAARIRQASQAQDESKTPESRNPETMESRKPGYPDIPTSRHPDIPKPVSPAPKIRLGSLGNSWSALRNNGRPAAEQEQKPDTESQETLHFTQEQLDKEWISMCNRMPEQYDIISTYMKTMHPTVTEFPMVEIVVENKVVYDQLQPILNRVTKTLRTTLHNNGITLSLRIAEHNEREKILSRREQYAMMLESNPALQKLSSLLALELV